MVWLAHNIQPSIFVVKGAVKRRPTAISHEREIRMEKLDLTKLELRRTGGRGGCGCCGFTMLGLLAVPMAAIISLFTLL
jgi:hypothetical protein